MKIRSVVGGIAAATLLGASPALAAVGAHEVSRKLNLDEQESSVGMDVRIGLGALQGDIGKRTGTGPLLGISAVAQIGDVLGFEVGYEGQRLPIDTPFVVSDQALYRHNVGILARAGPLIKKHWRPFVGAGAGLTLFNPTQGAEALFNNDFAEEVPVVAGLDYNFGHIFAGARATYRFMFGEGFADDAFPDANTGNLLNGTLTVGGRF